MHGARIVRDQKLTTLQDRCQLKEIGLSGQVNATLSHMPKDLLCTGPLFRFSEKKGRGLPLLHQPLPQFSESVWIPAFGQTISRSWIHTNQRPSIQEAISLTYPQPSLIFISEKDLGGYQFFFSEGIDQPLIILIRDEGFVRDSTVEEGTPRPGILFEWERQIDLKG
jgi:hypothetical protein